VVVVVVVRLLLLLAVVRESSRCAIRHDVGHARGPKKAEATSKEPEQREERELGAGEANSGPITVLRGARGSEEHGSNTIAIAAVRRSFSYVKQSCDVFTF
jgi:hypothetical protein